VKDGDDGAAVLDQRRVGSASKRCRKIRNVSQFWADTHGGDQDINGRVVSPSADNELDTINCGCHSLV
jgi:hypothetical protein